MTAPAPTPAVTRALARLVERNATGRNVFAGRAYTTVADALPDGYTLDPTTPGMWQLTMPAGRGGWAFLEGADVSRLYRAAQLIHQAEQDGRLLHALTQAGAQIVGGEPLWCSTSATA